MDMVLFAVAGAAVVAVVALFTVFKARTIAAVETTAEKAGLDIFLAIQKEIQSQQQSISTAKVALAQAQAKFVSLQTSVAQLTLPTGV